MILEDSAVLRYAGLMGHTIVGVIGERGRRRKGCECNTVEEANHCIPDDGTLAIYRRQPGTGRRPTLFWQIVQWPTAMTGEGIQRIELEG